MRFALILLVLLIAACALGSVISQNKSYEWYLSAYNERTAAVIMALYLDDVYHSPWFIAIAAFLCGNLLLCNLTRIAPIVRRTKAAADPTCTAQLVPTVTVTGAMDAEAVFSALSMPKPQAYGEGLFSSKNRLGYWGAWVCHLGILLLILGFGLGQMTHTEYTVYGVAGQTKPIGETGYALTIDDFTVDLREDDTVAQYTANLTAQSPDGHSQQAEVSVNHPETLFGMKFYQNSTGWAANVRVTKDGAALQETVLCAGESLPVSDKPDLVVHFRAFYPDYVFVQGSGPSTASGTLKNPAYLYSVTYLGEVIGMNVLTGDETIKIDEYEVRFSAPQSYTLIQIKRDRFTALALAGGVLTLLGLILAFYVLPKTLWAAKEQNGWTIYGYCPKGGALFAAAVQQAAETQGGKESASN